MLNRGRISTGSTKSRPFTRVGLGNTLDDIAQFWAGIGGEGMTTARLTWYIAAYNS